MGRPSCRSTLARTIRTALGKITVEDIFQPRLGAVGPVTFGDEDTHDRIGDFAGFVGLDDGAGLARQILVSRNTAENELEPDAGCNTGAIFDFDGLETDVIGVFQRRNGAAAIESDIEFAGQTIERALVQDMKVPRTGIGPGIDQFLPA